MTEDMADAVRHEMKIDLQGLIRLLAKNLYTEADAFVRELIQNAHDSCQRRHVIEPDAPSGLIQIHTNYQAGTITLHDNGSGLTETEIHEYLATIGRSGTAEFRQTLLEKGRQAEATLIGQFGIGLLSAFVVAYRVEVETLSVQSSNPAWKWISTGQRYYQLLPGERQKVGTTITLFLTDQYRDLLQTDELRKAIKKYADFIPIQIFLNDGIAPVNTLHAPWHYTYADEQEKLEAYRAFISQRFSDQALEVIPIELKTPFQIDGVLYIPDHRSSTLNATGLIDIYQHRMFVTSNHRDLLPSWAKFVHGIIDSPNLTLTASRDTIQLDETALRMKELLGKKVTQHLLHMFKQDPTDIERLMAHHSYHIKGMAIEADDFFDAIADLVSFETNKGIMSLHSYCTQSQRGEGRDDINIFYFDEYGSATQFYTICNEQDLLVINASHTFEESFLKKFEQRRDGIHLHRISESGLNFLFEQLTDEDADHFRALETEFRRYLADPNSRVKTVYLKPDTLPAVTILNPDAKLQKELTRTKNNTTLPDSIRNLVGRLLQERPTLPITLYLNAQNATIQQLAKMSKQQDKERETYTTAVRAICNTAILLTQQLLTPENVQILFETSNQTIKMLVQQAEQIRTLQHQLIVVRQALQESEELEQQRKQRGSINIPEHTICLVALPFQKEDTTFPYRSVLLPALRSVLESAPYYWQVMWTDETHYTDMPEQSIIASLQRASMYIVDISDMQRSILMALGHMRKIRKSWQPVVVLERGQAGKRLADLADVTRIAYSATDGPTAIDELSALLREAFAHDEHIQQLNGRRQEHYLSPLWLQDTFGVKEKIAEDLAKMYVTFERFAQADSATISQATSGLPRPIAQVLHETVVATLKGLRNSQ